jgi:hypothetical protein
MTIAKVGGFINKTAARRSDRGGSIMDLVSELLLKFDYNDSRKRYKAETNENLDDYGYDLYQSLEYGFKYLKSDDFGFRANSLNTMKK